MITNTVISKLLRRFEATKSQWNVANAVDREFPASTYRINDDNVHGYKEEGTITAPVDMAVLDDLNHFYLAMDAIDRLPQSGDKGIVLKQQLKDKLTEHNQHIDEHGQDMPEIRNWKWSKPQ